MATNRVLYVTLATCAAGTLLCTLALYAVVFNRNPVNRLGYAIFVSLVPVIGALLVTKVTKIGQTRLGVIALYLILFLLTVILQGIGRLITL